MSDGLRIPKINVPLICHTLQGEKLGGDIFLDIISGEGYTAKQVVDFFNAQPPFFPFRPSKGAKPLLIRKQTMVQVDLVDLADRYHEETSFELSVKREAVLYMDTLGPVRAVVLLDLPEEYSRILDLLTLKKMFFPAVIDGMFVLLNQDHVYKIEEL